MNNIPQTDNKGGFYDDYGDLKVYEEKLKRRKKRTKKILAVIALFLVFSIVFTLFFFSYHTLSYDEMYGGIQTVEQDGLIRFYLYATDSGEIGRIGRRTFVVFDYENGIKYMYEFLQITVQRWHLWFNKGVTDLEYVVRPNGRDYRKSNDWNFDPDIDYQNNPIEMTERYIRVYYANPDGTYVLIWELPEAQEIAERVGVELPEPDYNFKSDVRNRR